MSVPSSPIRRFEMRGGAWLMSIVLCAVLVVLSLGIVASPLRAIAAPAPVLIAYDAAVGPTSTTIQARAKTQHDSTAERGASTPTHCDGSALLGYDAVSNARMTASAEAGRAGGGGIDLADERENGVAATICDALAATTAAEAGVTVTQDGLAAVAEHLAQFGEHAPNRAMLERLGGQVGSAVTGADANFYTHELLEAGHMASGMSYEAAHAAALQQAGVSPFSLYHPEVIQQFPAEFNNAWRAFWGL